MIAIAQHGGYIDILPVLGGSEHVLNSETLGCAGIICSVSRAQAGQCLLERCLCKVVYALPLHTWHYHKLAIVYLGYRSELADLPSKLFFFVSMHMHFASMQQWVVEKVHVHDSCSLTCQAFEGTLQHPSLRV